MHHPFHALKQLPDWEVSFESLPDGMMGYTDWDSQTIVLSKDLGQAERRCTIAHELEHIRRGPVAEGGEAREERLVDEVVARQLIGIRELGEAMAWSQHVEEVAEDLWVDVDTVRVRLASLHPSERAYLKRRLRDVG